MKWVKLQYDVVCASFTGIFMRLYDKERHADFFSASKQNDFTFTRVTFLWTLVWIATSHQIDL